MERVVTVDDHPVRYLSAGTGPELVLSTARREPGRLGGGPFPAGSVAASTGLKPTVGTAVPAANHDVGLPTVCGRTGRVSITGW
jgi:hypothetical protein